MTRIWLYCTTKPRINIHCFCKYIFRKNLSLKIFSVFGTEKLKFYGSRLWYRILGEHALFGRKFRKYPILDEKSENTPFWAQISEIPYFVRNCPFLGENPDNIPFWAKTSLYVQIFENTPCYYG